MKKIFLLSVFFLLLYSCKKDEVRHVPLDPLVKATFDWHEGSYWVMQDSATGQIDSFYVYYYNRFEDDGYMDYIYECVTVAFKEVNVSNPNEATNWFVYMNPTRGVQYGDLCYRYDAGWDSLFRFNNFFPCPKEYSDFSFVSNRKQYQNVYFNSTVFIFGTNPLGVHLTAALNYNEGIVYLSSYCTKYKHTWYLLRHNIVRKP